MAGRPARTHIQQLCADTGCKPEDLPGAMDDREEWRERARDFRADDGDLGQPTNFSADSLSVLNFMNPEMR